MLRRIYALRALHMPLVINFSSIFTYLFNPESLDIWHLTLTQIVSSCSRDAGVWREDDRYSQVNPDMFTNSCNADINSADDELRRSMQFRLFKPHPRKWGTSSILNGVIPNSSDVLYQSLTPTFFFFSKACPSSFPSTTHIVLASICSKPGKGDVLRRSGTFTDATEKSALRLPD